MLSLESPSIIKNIQFGKYEKTHVCNLKKFKVYGGMDPDNLLELLNSGLKNDSTPESFLLKHKLHGQPIPSKLVKIVPLEPWAASYNFSIWHIGLRGIKGGSQVTEAIKWHNEFREKEAIRLCLKHFRQHNYLEAFESLQKKTRISLEHPLLTELHRVLVDEGNYEKTEELLEKASCGGLFSLHLSRQQPRHVWSPLIPPQNMPQISPRPGGDSRTGEGSEQEPDDMEPAKPSPRGGHQLVIDAVGQNIYLFGGWDGLKDLSDFWVFNIASSTWTLLSADTEAEGGPPPRSCHKMVLDHNFRQIFVLGQYLERIKRESESSIKSDFYVYDIRTSNWTQITPDTSTVGGPSLIFDHQMCLDQEKRDIYVFGGQALHVHKPSDPPHSQDKKYSGLYVYHVSNNTWRLLWQDGEQVGDSIPPIRSRTGHSMLFNNVDRCLYVFGGQRGREDYLNDFFTYNVDSEQVKYLSDGSNVGDSTIPAVGYTQRAVIDCARGEIHVMTGLNKDKDKSSRSGESKVSNSFWFYQIGSGSWSLLYRNENNTPGYWSKRQTVEPRPRYAHQLVYDESSGVHFIFGGNPGGKEGADERQRLGDFWKLQLLRPNIQDFQRQMRLLVRRYRFKELRREPMAALAYLQGDLSSCVDHEDKREEKEFQLLAGSIFSQADHSSEFELRTSLYEELVSFFPPDMTQPSGNLLDLVPLEPKSSRDFTSNKKED